MVLRFYLDYLSAHKVEDRLNRATQLFVKQASITEVSKKIANAVDESLSKQQKAYFLRQQLAAIQWELAWSALGKHLSMSQQQAPERMNSHQLRLWYASRISAYPGEP